MKKISTIINAAEILITKASFVGLRLLALYLCARIVAPREFGALALAFTLAEFIRYLVDWGTDIWSLRYFSNARSYLPANTFVFVIKQKLVATLLGFFLATLAIAIYSGELEFLSAILIAATLITNLWMGFAINWLQARNELRNCARITACLSGLGSLVLIGSNIYFTTRSQTLIALLIAIELIIASSAIFFAFRSFKRISGAVHSQSWKNWAVESTPIAFTLIITIIYSKVDQVVVKQLVGGAFAGSYLLVQKLVEPALFVAAAVAASIYSRVSRNISVEGWSNTRESFRVKRFIYLSAVAFFLLCSAIGSLGFFYVSEIGTYSDLNLLLPLAVVTTAFRCVNQLLTSFIQSQGRFYIMLNLSIINASIIGSLMFILFKCYGIIGVPIAVLVGEMINCCIQARICLRKDA